MKAILMSVHAKWCALMMNGKKKVEVRKGTALYKATQKLIDEYGFAEFYVCCSKINRKHYHLIEVIDIDTGKTEYEIDYYIGGSEDYLKHCYDGKVAFKFRCYKVEEITLPYTKFNSTEWVGCEAQRTLQTKTLDEKDLLKLSCLKEDEIYGYLNFKNSHNNVGCAIHISDLEIFDRPKELSEFTNGKYIFSKNYKLELYKLTKAPQSFCYIEVGE